MKHTLSEEHANAVWDVLIDFGANESNRQNFLHSVTRNPSTREYRFGGIAPGAKFWPEDGKVTIYPEARTPERDAKVDECNRRLADLRTPRGSES